MPMVSIQIIGIDTTIAVAGKEGPLLHSMRIVGAELDEAKIKEYVDRSVLMVTALSPVIGYDRVIVPLAMTRPGTADQA